ncbi:MAG TPA: hypothetical protein VL982_00465 [Burkholderiales bacterium]|jgi:hypothetical protein|nr:hypothetical protein [Burkholderiales bacterium]
MKSLKMMAAVAAAVAIFGANAIGDDRVAGESLDSGLGELSASYTGAEFNMPGWVRGESMDSGLGELDKSYTGAEYMPATAELAVGNVEEDLANWRCGSCS